MDKPITLQFSDTVKRIGKNPEKGGYSVIFRRKAAFYSIEEDNVSSLEALNRSARESIPVKVESDALSSKILKAEIAAM